MFRSYNYFQRHNKNKEIKNYKKFYKDFSNRVEFGGDHSSSDYLINKRFADTTNAVMSTVLRTQPKSILDLGCGAGVYLPLSRYFENIPYHGVDYATKAIAAAQKTYPNIKFSKGDLFDFRALKKSDLIILSCVLVLYEKREDRDKILRTLRFNLNTDGTGIVVVWNDTIFIRLCHILSRFIARLKGVALPVDFMCLHFTEREMRTEFKENGFDVVDVIHNSARYGALECAQYLSLKKYKRNFSEEIQLHKKVIPLNEFDDFCNEVGTKKLWVKILYKLSFIFPSWVAMYSTYIVRKN